MYFKRKLIYTFYPSQRIANIDKEKEAKRLAIKCLKRSVGLNREHSRARFRANIRSKETAITAVVAPTLKYVDYDEGNDCYFRTKRPLGLKETAISAVGLASPRMCTCLSRLKRNPKL